MNISGKNAASIGFGCLVDVALFVVLVLAFSEDCAVIGPIGMLVCLALALVCPIYPSAEELVTIRLKDLGVKLKAPTPLTRTEHHPNPVPIMI